MGFGKTQNFLDGIRDLTSTREAGFKKILAWDEVLEKQTVFGIEVMEVRGEELLRKKKAGNKPTKTTLKRPCQSKISYVTRYHSLLGNMDNFFC